MSKVNSRLDAIAAVLAPAETWWTPEQFDAEVARIGACMPTLPSDGGWRWDGQQFVPSNPKPGRPPVNDCGDCCAYVALLMETVVSHTPEPTEPPCWATH